MDTTKVLKNIMGDRVSKNNLGKIGIFYSYDKGKYDISVEKYDYPGERSEYVEQHFDLNKNDFDKKVEQLKMKYNIKRAFRV